MLKTIYCKPVNHIMSSHCVGFANFSFYRWYRRIIEKKSEFETYNLDCFGFQKTKLKLKNDLNEASNKTSHIFLIS